MIMLLTLHVCVCFSTQTYQTYTGIDNLYVDPDTGDVWTAGHPMRWKTILWVSDIYNRYSPSQVHEPAPFPENI